MVRPAQLLTTRKILLAASLAQDHGAGPFSSFLQPLAKPQLRHRTEGMSWEAIDRSRTERSARKIGHRTGDGGSEHKENSPSARAEMDARRHLLMLRLTLTTHQVCAHTVRFWILRRARLRVIKIAMPDRSPARVKFGSVKRNGCSP